MRAYRRRRAGRRTEVGAAAVEGTDGPVGSSWSAAGLNCGEPVHNVTLTYDARQTPIMNTGFATLASLPTATTTTTTLFLHTVSHG